MSDAPTPPPLPLQQLNYQGRLPREPLPPIPNFWKKLVGGLLIGAALSCLMWIPAFAFGGNSDSYVFFSLFLLAAKVIVAIVLACIRNLRPWGIGLLISLPIGAIIFFGACAANFNPH